MSGANHGCWLMSVGRRRAVGLLVAWLVLAAATGCGRNERSIQANTSQIGVERLARNPAAYDGRALVIRGVVSRVAADRRLFTVIDRSEYDACRELGCAEYEIPVEFAGALPETTQAVLVTGRVEQPQPGRYLVRADRVERTQ